MEEIEQTVDDILDVLSEAKERNSRGTKFHGMSYEEGVIAALEWVVGDTDASPMED